MADWTPERVEKLKQLWDDGLSANQIARALGGLTRCAAIEKVHRLGLPPRDKDSKYRNHHAGNSQVKKPRALVFPGNLGSVPKFRTAPVKIATDVEAPKPAVDAAGQPITVLNASRLHCRYVHGDITNGTYRYCGHTVEKGSWCAYHRARCCVPPVPRKHHAP